MFEYYLVSDYEMIFGKYNLKWAHYPDVGEVFCMKANSKKCLHVLQLNLHLWALSISNFV